MFVKQENTEVHCCPLEKLLVIHCLTTYLAIQLRNSTAVLVGYFLVFRVFDLFYYAQFPYSTLK